MAVLDELTPADDEMTNILLAHAGNHGAIPIDYPTIRKAGFDYIGLGHEASYKNMYNGRICYPGVLNRTITGRPTAWLCAGKVIRWRGIGTACACITKGI